jgi:hypothetical protein
LSRRTIASGAQGPTTTPARLIDSSGGTSATRGSASSAVRWIGAAAILAKLGIVTTIARSGTAAATTGNQQRVGGGVDEGTTATTGSIVQRVLPSKTDDNVEACHAG